MGTRSEDILNRMTLEEKIGQLLFLRVIEDQKQWPSEETRILIEEIKPGAMRIYGSHPDPFFLAQYTNLLQKWSSESNTGIPLILAADCEGGLSSLITHDSLSYPLLMGVTATGSVKTAEAVARAIGRQARAVGLNMLHQPVADLNTNPVNPIIGLRSPGDDPETAAKYASAFLRGLQKTGIISTAKHYPGHGDTSKDSHLELPRLEYGKEVLSQHLRPFSALIDAGVDGIMTAHIVVSCIDPDRPATLSPHFLNEILRTRQGFKGVVVSDSMGMKAITSNYEPGLAAVEAFKAGVDLILANGDPEFQRRNYRGLLNAVKNGSLQEDQVDRSAGRILNLKRKYGLLEGPIEVEPLSARETLLNPDALRTASRSYQKSFTLCGRRELLPISREEVLFTTGPKPAAETLASYLREEFNYVLSAPLNSAAGEKNREPAENDIQKIMEFSTMADRAVVIANTQTPMPGGQKHLIEKLAERMPVIVISLGLPYGFNELPEGIAFLATYLKRIPDYPPLRPEGSAGRVLTDILSGRKKAEGVLPVKV